jgi:iron(III) transport system ATP-binding protein
MHLRVQGVTKTFGENIALNNVSFDVGAEEFVCLLGPSGCGKTTLLRLVAGLMLADSGSLILDGEDLSRTPARKRGFGIVFQSYSLFPSMTVADNVAFGLAVRRAESSHIQSRVKELLELVGLGGMADRYPWQLSGGQQQRVAIARAIAVQPRLLLLDEPLSALDAKVRAQLREEIKQLQRKLRIPTIMVTHDQEEALLLADKIVCMKDGLVAQIGTPHELYHSPSNRFVADFMGTSNLVPAAALKSLVSDLQVSSSASEQLICVRPEDIILLQGSDSGVGGKGVVKDIHFLGDKSRIQVETSAGALWATRLGMCAFRPGDEVHVSIQPQKCVALAEG